MASDDLFDRTTAIYPKRADVQGIRAIAVIAVIGYHFDLIGFSGGFVGVDIFFALSGYLITQLILRGLESGQFSFSEFYARRLRRLLPNAILTLAATLIASSLILPAYRLGTIGWDAFYAAIFSVNYRFLNRAVDYFSYNEPQSPLLHFWSLSIEEQFYLLFPATLVILSHLMKSARRWATTVALMAMTLLSFFWSIYMLPLNAPYAFFSLDARVWQLCSGGVLAALPVSLLRFNSFTVLPATILMGLSIVFFRVDMLYPGYLALMPVGATLLLIAAPAPTGTFLAGVLGNRWLCWIGDRSYSLYLWHWPIFILVRPFMPQGIIGTTLILAFILIVAALSYTYVEQRFRSKPSVQLFPMRTLCIGFGAIAMVALAGASWNRLEPMLATSNIDIYKQIGEATTLRGEIYTNGCHLSALETVARQECIFGDANAQKTILLFGDSHAAQWFSAIDKAALSQHWRFYSFTKSGCPSSEVNMLYLPRRGVFTECQQWRDAVLQRLQSGTIKADIVVLANRFDYQGWLLDGEGQKIADSGTRATILAGTLSMASTLQRLGAEVVSIIDTPTALADYRACLLSDGGERCLKPKKDALRNDRSDAAILSQDKSLKILNFNEVICPQSPCPLIDKGMVIYRDIDHLNSKYIETFAPDFERLLRDRIQ